MSVTAIILAAGANRRMGAGETPKPLLPLPGLGDGTQHTLIGRSVALLRGQGVSDIHVVVREADRDRYSEALPDVSLIELPQMSSPEGSTVSLAAALSVLSLRPPQGGLLVADGDIVYERAIAQQVWSALGDGSVLFTIGQTVKDDEEVRVYGEEPARPRLIGKGLGLDVTDGLCLFGESIGIIHVAASNVKRVCAIAQWLVGDGAKRPPFGFAKRLSEHEEVWQYCFALGILRIVPLPGELVFAECDTQLDYDMICTDVWPRVVAADAGGIV